MEIQRVRHSSIGGVIRRRDYEYLRTVEATVAERYVAYVQENGGVQGEDYEGVIMESDQLDDDLARQLTQKDVGPYYVETNRVAWGVGTKAMHLATKTGVSRFVDHEDEYFVEYGTLDPDTTWRMLGSRVVRELVERGSQPECADIAAIVRKEVFDPSDYDLRKMTKEHYARSVGTIPLDHFTVDHFADLHDAYYQVAYPGGPENRLSRTSAWEIYSSIQQGNSVGLRNGTAHLDCAKQQYRVDSGTKILATSVYLNYEIPLSGVNLHFVEDLDLCLAYGAAARRILGSKS